MKTNNWLSEFVNWAVTLDGDTSGKLTPNEKNQIIETLEKCVSHERLLRRYLASIQLALDGNVRDNGFLTIAEADRVANEGLAVLESGDLVKIALDPVSMWALHEAVREKVFERWANRKIEADAELLNLGLVDEDLSQPTRTGFPWDQLDLVSPQSLSALLTADDIVPLPQWMHKTIIPCGRGVTTHQSVTPKPQRFLAAVGSAAPRWTWLNDLSAWLLTAPEAVLELVPAMSDDATDREAVIETPTTVRESCPWADSIKIHRSATVLTIQAIGPKTPESKSSLKVWIVEKPEQVEVLANDQRVGFLDTSENEPQLLLAIEREE